MTDLSVILLAAVLALGAAVLVILIYQLSLRRRSEGESQIALAELRGKVDALAQESARKVDALQTALQQTLQETRRAMDSRLDNAAGVIRQVSTQLGEVKQSSQSILDMSRQLSELQNILRAPKLRGGLGELFLQELLAQILPPQHYEMQHAFGDGFKVDAVIRLLSGTVPVDAKFPLENFRRLSEATDESARKEARREFVRNVKKHVDDIASKYIRPDEGTFDFALMYIPAENVYYEAIVKDDEFGGEQALFTYALSRRVIPVSPNSFYAYLQTILLGLRGLRVEESARVIINQLASLHQAVARFDETFRVLGKHLKNATQNYDQSEKDLAKLQGKMDQIEGLAQGAGEPPAALPPGS